MLARHEIPPDILHLHTCHQTDRLEGLEDSLGSLNEQIAELRKTIGEPPGLGGPGSGMAAILYRLSNYVMFGTTKESVESIVSGTSEDYVSARNRELTERDDKVTLAKSERNKLIATVFASAVGGGGLLGMAQAILNWIGG